MKSFNVFEPAFEYDETDPDGFHAGMDRFGPKIGAYEDRRLGLRAPARPGAVPVPLRVRRGVADGPRRRR